jgi:hypothetical protein
MPSTTVDTAPPTELIRPAVRALARYEPASRTAPRDGESRFVPPPRRPNRPLTGLAVATAGSGAAGIGAASPPSDAVPHRFGNGHPFNARFTALLTKILEALDGRRQVDQLRAVLADPVYQATRTRSRLLAPTRVRYQLRSLHSCRLGRDAVEVSGVLHVISVAGTRPRARALAARFETPQPEPHQPEPHQPEPRTQTWRCTVLRLL